MQLEERIVGKVAIIGVGGNITADKGADVILKDKVQSLIHQGYLNLLVDLRDVSYVSSAGLGQLVQAYAIARNRGGALKLLNPTTRIQDLLVVTRLVTVFDTFDGESEALASFAGVAAA